MIALTFTDLKEISAQLLTKSTFDSFLVREILITGNYTFSIDPASESSMDLPYGKVRPMIGDFLSLSAKEDEASDPASLDLGLTPGGRIVLCASPSYQETLMNNPAFTGDPELIRGLILTFRWNKDSVTAMTGVSHATFTPDKSIDKLWDQGIKKAFDHTSLSYELM